MKNNIKKMIACQLTLLMALSVGTNVTFAKKAKTNIKLNKTKITLKKLRETNKKASASTSNKKIATVSTVKKKKNQWKIKGIKAGKARITVKVNKKKYTCKVTVVDDTAAKNKAAAKKVEDLISELPTTGNLTVNDEAELNATSQAYNKLTSQQKKYVSSSAKAKLAALLKQMPSVKQEYADKTAAQKVTNQIVALPSVANLKGSDETNINSAKAAYDALSATAKTYVNSALVDKLNSLIQALPGVKQKEQLDANIKKVQDATQTTPLSVTDGGITYQIANVNGKLEFRVRNESMRNGKVALGDYFFMVYDYPTDTVKLSLYETSDLYIYGYSAKSSMNLTDIDLAPSPVWTVDSNYSSSSTRSIANSADGYFILGLDHWNTLLKNNLGLNLASIGFTKYPTK